MSNTKILIVDDEPTIVNTVRAYLEPEGFTVQTAMDGNAGLSAARTFAPDLIILDVMLPGLDGIQVLRRVRQSSNVYVLMLTAKADETDKVVGLSVGADDYLTKPFSPRELVARVKAVLRRANPAPKTQRLVVGDITLDADRREVMVGKNLIELRAKEFDLLAVLMQNPGIVLTRERLLEIAWGFDFPGETRTVDVHVAHLRKKMATAKTQIETVSGVGYKLVG